MTAIELSPEMHAVASREAQEAGMSLAAWLEVAIARHSKGELPYDDCGWPIYQAA